MSGYFAYTRKAWDKKFFKWPNSKDEIMPNWLVGMGVGIIASGIAVVIAAAAVIALLSPPGLLFGTIMVAGMVVLALANSVGWPVLKVAAKVFAAGALDIALLLPRAIKDGFKSLYERIMRKGQLPNKVATQEAVQVRSVAAPPSPQQVDAPPTPPRTPATTPAATQRAPAPEPLMVEQSQAAAPEVKAAIATSQQIQPSLPSGIQNAPALPKTSPPPLPPPLPPPRRIKNAPELLPRPPKPK